MSQSSSKKRGAEGPDSADSAKRRKQRGHVTPASSLAIIPSSWNAVNDNNEARPSQPTPGRDPPVPVANSSDSPLHKSIEELLVKNSDGLPSSDISRLLGNAYSQSNDDREKFRSAVRATLSSHARGKNTIFRKELIAGSPNKFKWLLNSHGSQSGERNLGKNQEAVSALGHDDASASSPGNSVRPRHSTVLYETPADRESSIDPKRVSQDHSLIQDERSTPARLVSGSAIEILNEIIGQVSPQDTVCSETTESVVVSDDLHALPQPVEVVHAAAAPVNRDKAQSRPTGLCSADKDHTEDHTVPERTDANEAFSSSRADPYRSSIGPNTPTDAHQSHPHRSASSQPNTPESVAADVISDQVYLDKLLRVQETLRLLNPTQTYDGVSDSTLRTKLNGSRKIMQETEDCMHRGFPSLKDGATATDAHRAMDALSARKQIGTRLADSISGLKDDAAKLDACSQALTSVRDLVSQKIVSLEEHKKQFEEDKQTLQQSLTDYITG